jgi:hypothetical protein
MVFIQGTCRPTNSATVKAAHPVMTIKVVNYGSRSNAAINNCLLRCQADGLLASPAELALQKTNCIQA